ncbi:PAAR domain-containing protein [Pseudomonas xanthosomatis]|uniref:PAAR domain-containing protein n=1 Tax=Pseudomonas xanthosomatis TaxID=2842356 RepID=UPI00351950A6
MTYEKELHMSGKPAARLSDPTVCPIPGHGPNTISSGSSDVIIEGLGAARLNDTSACGSPITGGVSSTVTINGLNAATVGSVGAHGNSIVAGAGTVFIGDTVISAPVTPVTPMPVYFSDKILLVNAETGKPLPNHAYAVQRANGSLEQGISDEMGYTHLISSNLAENIKLFVQD